MPKVPLFYSINEASKPAAHRSTTITIQAHQGVISHQIPSRSNRRISALR
jgi:hypothetical protein